MKKKADTISLSQEIRNFKKMVRKVKYGFSEEDDFFNNFPHFSNRFSSFFRLSFYNCATFVTTWGRLILFSR